MTETVKGTLPILDAGQYLRGGKDTAKEGAGI